MGNDPNPDSVTDDKKSVPLSISQLKDMFTGLIDERIGAIKGDIKTPAADEKPGATGRGDEQNVADQVKAALDRLHKQEAREQRERGWDEAIEELKNSLKPTEDAAPVERRKIHKFMGWGEPDK